MKPFNLEKALAGETVVTRGGEKVTQLHLFDCPKIFSVLYGVVAESDIFSYSPNGKYYEEEENEEYIEESVFDLFMANPKKTVYRNTFKFVCGDYDKLKIEDFDLAFDALAVAQEMERDGSTKKYKIVSICVPTEVEA